MWITGWHRDSELLEVVQYIMARLKPHTLRLKCIAIRTLFWVRSLAEEHDLCFEERAELQAAFELAIVFDELSPGI